MKLKKPRKTQIYTGFDDYQIDWMEAIGEFENIDNPPDLIRKAFDFYVKENYPQLVNSGS